MEIDLSPFRRARSGDLTEQVEFPLPSGPTPLGAEVRLAEPAAVTARVTGGPFVIEVEVAARLHLVQPCDRCLEPVSLDVSVEYAEEWHLGARAAHEAPGTPENLDRDDALVVRRTVTSSTGTLDDGFWQNVALELPVKVLCAEDCKGLCPRCGANRNRTTCACPSTDPDPRLGALAQFRPARKR